MKCPNCNTEGCIAGAEVCCVCGGQTPYCSECWNWAMKTASEDMQDGTILQFIFNDMGFNAAEYHSEEKKHPVFIQETIRGGCVVVQCRTCAAKVNYPSRFRPTHRIIDGHTWAESRFN